VGDVLSLLGAFFYAVYATYLKIKVPEEEESSFKFSYFLGFVGFFNDFLLIPLFFLFDYTQLETFEWPSKNTVLLLSVNALIGTFVSDYCWARSVVLLGPLVTTLGITLTFPISALFDHFVNGKDFSWLYMLGSFFIFTAFLVILYFDHRRTKMRELENQRFNQQ